MIDQRLLQAALIDMGVWPDLKEFYNIGIFDDLKNG